MASTITRQDSLFYTHRLDNGLQMVGQSIPGVRSATAVFWVRTGTRDEEPEQMGISHFLEHMAFRGSKDLPGDQIDRAFEEMGAEHNAGTWLEMTFYWARVLSENVDRVLYVLSQLMQPEIDDAAFEQERNVILEEIARYEDMPTHILVSNFMRDFFGDHPLARETLGTPETIKNLTSEQMRSYWATRYGTENVIFAIAGHFDWNEVVAELERLTANWPAGNAGRALAPTAGRPGFHVYGSEKFTQEHMAIGVATVPRDHSRYYAAAVLATILGDDTGSRLFWALHQTGLAEVAVAQTLEFDDNGLLFAHIATEPTKAQQALDAALEAMDRVQSFDVEQAELDRAKAKLISSIIIGGESTSERVMSLIRSWLTRGSLETLEEVREKVERVTLEDLRDLLNEYPLGPRRVITAIGPVAENELTVAE